MAYFLSIDVGTQSTRGIIFDEFGNLVVKEKVAYKAYIPNENGFAERDADFYWDIICHVINKIKDENHEYIASLSGVALVTMRNTVVPVDKEGRPLRPAILWLDQRMAKAEEALNPVFETGVSLIGQGKKIDNFRKVFKWQWIKENEPEVANNTYKYMLLSSYLNYKLTGEFVDSEAAQIGYVPYDFKKKRWAKKSDVKSIVFPIERSKLVGLKSVGESLGAITKEASEQTGIQEGISVIATGSDKGCETIGAGAIDSSISNLSLGSAVTIQTTHHKYIEMSRFVPSYPAAMPNKFNPEVQINRGYWMVNWFKNEFAEKEVNEALEKDVPVETLLNNLLDQVNPGSDGLMLQPYWGGDLNDPYAKGAVIGFTDVTTRAHLYRAIIEGINYAVIDGIHLIQKKMNCKIKTIVISGGGSQSDNICQITADMTGIPVSRIQTYETACLGASIAGFVSAGVYASYEEAIEKMVHSEETFEPNEKKHKVYDQLYKNVYKKIYPNLKGIYKELGKIVGNVEE